MGSPFDDQPHSEPLPFAERRHLDELGSQRRQTHLLIALAIALPVLAAMVLVVCLVLPMMRGPRVAIPDSQEPIPGSVEDRETPRERQQREAEERAEEELRAIRQRIDRGIESKQREAQRRERGLPPRLSDSEDEEN